MTDRRHFLRRSGLAAGSLILPGLSVPPLAGHFPASGVLRDPPLVQDVDPHQLIAQAWLVLAATEVLGAPFAVEDMRALRAMLHGTGDAAATEAAAAIQRVLDRSCLVDVQVNPEMRVKVARGPAHPALVGGEWGTFLVKVRNEAGVTAALRATVMWGAHRWLEVATFDDAPLPPTLSGLQLEYRIVRLRTHAVGRREASLAFDVGQGSQDLGFRSEVPILLDCRVRGEPALR